MRRVTIGLSLTTLAMAGVLIACSSGTEPHDNAPPGTEIVFQAGDSTSADIWVVNADGSGLARLTDYPDADRAPTWSADGRQIYFLSNRAGPGTSDLYAMNPDGTNVHLVADSILVPYAVSPDGTRIALGVKTGSPYPHVDLFVMNADGSGLTLVADLPCDIYYTHCEHLDAVAWSPDGQRIAYSASWQGHAFTTYAIIGVVNADGTGQQVLTTADLRCTHPAWAPDGQRIVFSSTPATAEYDHRPIDLEIINADGTGRTVLLDGDVAGSGTSPSWSPDGQSIVFVQSGGLYAINVDGTGLRHITDAPGYAFAPDWNPVAP